MTRKRGRRADDEPLLFDLPLVPDESTPGTRGGEGAPVQPELFAVPDAAGASSGGTDEPGGALRRERDETAGLGGPVVAGIGSRAIAGCADALLHLGVLAGLYLGLLALGVEPRLEHWPALATVLVAFSFLSSVVSLAFWGQTAGMAWRGLQSRDRLQRPLSFRQAALRWAGGLVTFAAAGLPLLLALRGASFGDLLSRSVTYESPASELELS